MKQQLVQKMKMQPELKVQMELDAHEKECAIRYQMVNDKLCTLDKKLCLWWVHLE